MTKDQELVLQRLRADRESEPYDGWKLTYLDNCIPDGMTRHRFAGHLGALEQLGLYRPDYDDEFKGCWGYVKMDTADGGRS